MKRHEQDPEQFGRRGLRPSDLYDYNGDDEEITDFQPMPTKQRPDDDLSHLPHLQSAIKALEALVFFTGQGDRVITKLDKEYAEAFVAAKHIHLEEGSSTLVLDSGPGYLALCLAHVNQQAQVTLYDSNLSDRALSKRNIDTNFIVQNVSLASESGLETAMNQGFDAIVYSPKNHTSLELIRAKTDLALHGLKQGGEFYLVTHKKQGGQRHAHILSQVTGAQVDTLARAKGGYRIFRAVKTNPSQDFDIDRYRQDVAFDILGHHFALQTEPSLFSKDGLDAGTRFLLETTLPRDFSRLLDLGSGWGAIGLVAATLNPDGQVVMVDIDTRASSLASDNAESIGLADRVTALATTDLNQLPGNFDLLLSNPPFHADGSQLITMFSQARNVMAKKAQGFVVVEDTYLDKITTILDQTFDRSSIKKKDPDLHFSVLQVSK